MLHPLRALAHLTTALVSALALALFATVAQAQSATTATVTGRVQNQAANLSLENARITVAGTTREAFTDAFGEYRLAGLTPGNITLTVFSTGLAPQTATVAVLAGSTAQRDFALVPVSTPGSAPSARTAAADGTVKLDSFVVAAARETNAATIAINEQRFAGTIKTVLSTDALGDVIQNNLGEFVKFLPGVDVGTDQMNTV